MPAHELVTSDEPAIFDARLRSRARELMAELEVVRVNAESNLEPIVKAIAELAELESVACHGVRNRAGQWTLERWCAYGPINATRAAAQSLFESSTELAAYDDLMALPRTHRNRLIDVRAWSERSGHGTWRLNPIVTNVLAPAGLGEHHLLRALLCEGASLIGWFGCVHPVATTPFQAAILGAFVAPLRARLVAEMRLRDTPYMRAALEAMLDRLGTPAFVLDSNATIQEANGPGRALLGAEPSVLGPTLRALIADGVGDGSFELIPIQDGSLRAWIAVRKDTTPDVRVARCIETCRVRWSLTPRQSEVLNFVVRGETNATIAGQLGCVERTVELHVTAIFDRAGVDSRSALVAAVLTS